MALENEVIEMFDKLKAHKDEQISYEIWKDGRLNILSDVLLDVKDYKGIKTSKRFVPFIDENEAIKVVKSLSNNEILYKNPYLKQGYGKEKEDVEAYIRDFFGDMEADYYMVCKKSQEDREKIYKDDITADRESKKKKLELIKEGINYVNPELLVNFVNYADSFGNNAFGGYILEKTVECMRKIESGEDLEVIDEYIKKSSRNSIIEILIAGNIIKYGKNGEEFKNNWAIKNGFIKEEKSFSNHR